MRLALVRSHGKVLVQRIHDGVFLLFGGFGHLFYHRAGVFPGDGYGEEIDRPGYLVELYRPVHDAGRHEDDAVAFDDLFIAVQPDGYLALEVLRVVDVFAGKAEDMVEVMLVRHAYRFFRGPAPQPRPIHEKEALLNAFIRGEDVGSFHAGGDLLAGFAVFTEQFRGKSAGFLD